jgi:subtilisin family serine protease
MMVSEAVQIAHLDVEKVWRTTRGRGVRVAVLDSDVSTSVALPPSRVLRVGLDGGRPEPSGDSHGTFCASLIASEKRDAEGVAPEAKILSIQIATNAGAIPARSVSRGLALALALGCDVISCSFTLKNLRDQKDAIAELVRRAHLGGIPLLAAHGNTRSNTAPFPENVQHAIVVSAHGLNGRPLSVNANEWTDVASLGERLTVVNAAGLTRRWAGKTSGATALVAGVVALGLAAVSKSKRERAGMAVEGLLKATATNAHADGVPFLRINARKFVDAMLSL